MSKLRYDESPILKDKEKLFYAKSISEIKDLTPEGLEQIFVSMSEEAQDSFLESLKGTLSPEEWAVLVIHLKSYQLMMMGDYTEKGSTIKEALATALYDTSNHNTSLEVRV